MTPETKQEGTKMVISNPARGILIATPVALALWAVVIIGLKAIL